MVPKLTQPCCHEQCVFTAYCFFRVNVLAMVFYFMFEIPGIGSNWLNYVLPVSMAVTIPFALLVKDQYRRSNIDMSCSSTPDNLSQADSTIDIRGAHLRFE